MTARFAPRRAPRATLLAALLLAGLLAWFGAGLHLGDLVPRGNGTAVLGEFCGAALRPALDYEVAPPPGSPPLLAKVLEALRLTVVFAAAGMSLALLLGTLLGFATATAWWSEGAGARAGLGARLLRRVGAPSLHVALRGVIAVMRAVHELLWAVLLLAAMGLNSFSAVCAIAIPYAGTLAKVFSDMLDECPRTSAAALRASGASGVQVFLFGLLPRALPDMAAYAFYRFECAVRSSAILGFFGFPTLGYFLQLAFANKHYRETWSYLWALIALVVALEVWSGALRRKVVMR
ncbi:MAG: ABC transporter permease subunit [Planctomycetes bacterium]|nr:ABC transporter permease subunit [Planctomycetota bacterium]